MSDGGTPPTPRRIRIADAASAGGQRRRSPSNTVRRGMTSMRTALVLRFLLALAAI
ncbi:hypothetical protein GS688_00310, partial [Rhodococcus hoagii]|nr:hypothetical protein [Prescottella equi]